MKRYLTAFAFLVLAFIGFLVPFIPGFLFLMVSMFMFGLISRKQLVTMLKKFQGDKGSKNRKMISWLIIRFVYGRRAYSFGERSWQG